MKASSIVEPSCTWIGVGFYLLPTTGSIGDHFGSAINADGDVIGTCQVNGSPNDSFLFFWTPLQPSNVTSFLPGLNMGTVGVNTVSNGHFTAYGVDGDPVNVYSYSVGSDGTFNYQLKI